MENVNLKNTITLWAAIARVLGHNGALSAEQAANCSSLRSANALMAAQGIDYNDTCEQGWLTGIEGWAYREGTLHHTTGTGRLEISVGIDSVELNFNSPAGCFARIYLSPSDEGLKVNIPFLNSESVVEKPSRLDLLNDFDTREFNGKIRAGLQYWASDSGKSFHKESITVLAAIDICQTGAWPAMASADREIHSTNPDWPVAEESTTAE